jgi:hypothetical protein
MSEIPSPAWIGIGILLTVLSLLIENLLLFVIPGVGFILFGASKLLISKNPPSAPKHTYNTKPRTTQQPPQTKRCYVCSAKNAAQANYCGHCGHKLT